MSARRAFAAMVALALPACAAQPIEAEKAAIYECVRAAGGFAPRARLPLAITVTEDSFRRIVAGTLMPRGTHAVYMVPYDVIVLSPRADRALLAHEMAHAFGVRHAPGADDFAQMIERETRAGRLCAPEPGR